MIEIARTPENSNELCLFCIDTQSDVVDDRVVTLDFNSYPDIACSCKIKTHVDCWMKYILHKGHIECPICHKLFEDQDAILRLPPQRQQPNIQIIYTQTYPLQMHQNPMMLGNTQTQSPIIMLPVPLHPPAVNLPAVHPIPDNEQWCPRSRNNGCILLSIVLTIFIYLIVHNS
jgi:hypothetical protein